MFLGIAAFAAAVTAVGWLLAVSVEARSATRSTIAWDVPLDRLPWQGPLARATASGPPALADPLPAVPAVVVRFDETPVLNPLGALAMLVPDPDDVTGSLGDARKAPAPVPMPSAAPAVPRSLASASMPLPKARPRLASLGPVPPDLGRAAPEALDLRRTAVYDITAKTVYLPNGARLEAHSGLGDYMDDPRHVRRRMRGATPPNVYTLKLREALFHGVRALRMTPADEDRMFGRDGILAHSYMLGPSGQSNGCVSFKNYPRFLRAYLNGEIDRIVVVARLARPPVFPGRAVARNTAAVE